MKGLELSRKFYEEYGKPMLEREFAPYLDRIAVGLAGRGSQCFGYDDEISSDHDFAPGFCIWLCEEDEQKIGFSLQRAYSKLPKEFCDISCRDRCLGGEDIFGVRTIGDYYSAYTGCQGAPECWQDWLYTPSYYFAEAVNGEVFSDPLGAFSAIREEIKNGMPEDVRLKKLASCALHMAQSGQYNYKRCLSHEEPAAARLALNEFVRYCSEAVFLLAKRHQPYYKWCFRAMRELKEYGAIATALEDLLLLPPDETLKIELSVEQICMLIVNELNKQGISELQGEFLEPHAYAINSKIKNSEIRNLHIFYKND